MTLRSAPAALLLGVLTFTFGAKPEANSVLAAGASSPAAQAADGPQAPVAPPAPAAAGAKSDKPPEAAPAVPATPLPPQAPQAAPPPARPQDAARPSAANDEDQALLRKLAEETARTRKLAEQLSLIESTPIEPPTAPIVPQARPPARIEDIPPTPLPQAREEYADALYALGKYGAARAVYAELADSKPPRTVLIWAQLQNGHCARRVKDYPAAVAAYEKVMTDFGESPWAKEAAWWSAEVKWWMLWNETVRRDNQPASPPSAAPAAPKPVPPNQASPATPTPTAPVAVRVPPAAAR